MIIAVSATSLVVFAVATDLVLRTANENDTASQWMKQLALFAPALHTAGAPMRHPETMHPGIDLRYGAGLERFP